MIGRDPRRWINDQIRTELLAMKIVNNNQFAAFVPYVLIIDRPERVSVYNHSITCLQGIEELLFFPDDLYLKTTFYQILLNRKWFSNKDHPGRKGVLRYLAGRKNSFSSRMIFI